MTQPRRTLVSLTDTPYYHCIGRCVRRAFLCGQDFATSEDYEHRKAWMVERLALLAEVFTLEVCAYAVMSNHYHVVLRIDRAAAEALSEAEVMDRWGRLYGLPVLVRRYRDGETTGEAEAGQARAMLAVLRARLGDLSWYMRCLNEYIARRANAEDGCTGRFWEGRFKSQALLDEAALLTCMSYVDLNRVRAGIATTPEASDYTSIQARIRRHREPFVIRPTKPAPVRLLPFQELGNPAPEHLPFGFLDYLALMDWTGRAVLEHKHGAIPAQVPPILERLGIAPAGYLKTMCRSGIRFGTAVGRVESLRDAARQLQRRCLRGIGEARLLFSTPVG
ncbi:MAG: hypothetical protein WED00_00925 [Aquisalimonadaceae bacterium]